VAALSDLTAGELKQRILGLYNATNQEIWGAGVRQQRVELLGDRILVVAVHQRVPALAALDEERRDLTRQVDVALMDRYKALFRTKLEDLLGLRVVTVLKDYDPETQVSCTVAMLEASLQTADR
jgi:hypothetical protein